MSVDDSRPLLSPEEVAEKQAQLLNRVWTDEVFKARFKSDPHAVLEELGIPVSPNIKINVVEDTDTVKHIHLPPMKGG